MVNYTAAFALRQRLGVIAARSVHQSLDRFTEADWLRSQVQREASDCLTLILRWCVTVSVSDGKARHFYLVGRLDDVSRRAALIFGAQTSIVAITPAGTHGAEVIDSRLSLSHP